MLSQEAKFTRYSFFVLIITMTKTRFINLCHSRQVEMVTIESAVHAEVIYFILLYSICTFNTYYLNLGDYAVVIKYSKFISLGIFLKYHLFILQFLSILDQNGVIRFVAKKLLCLHLYWKADFVMKSEM